jgi:FtsP/CotA-like multicopper oxidase with cupredoxin domain
MNRREFLESMTVSAAALAARSITAPAERLAGFVQAGPSFTPDVDLELTARPAQHEIYPGKPTATWRYQGKLVKGRAGTLEESGSYLGPTIRLHNGDRVRVRFRNELPETTIVHWHGLVVPALMDGHPRLVIANGAEYVYEFEVKNRAGHYWYHPHPHDRTGPQIYRGLAGNLFIHDQEESALRLPSGEHEIALIIQDRTFDGDQQLTYISGHMDAMTGFLGERILVNGTPEKELKLATGVYRLRLLNGSNSRIYKLAWSNGMPFTVIGTDGGLLERPVKKPYLTLAPAERADVILDLSGQTAGSTFELRSRRFPAPQMMMGRGMSGMGRGMGGPMRGSESAMEQGAEFRVLRVRMGRKEKGGYRLPARLSNPAFHRAQEADHAGSARVYPLSFMRMQWFLNESTFEMEAVKENEVFKTGGLYTLEFRNESMGMMQMAHPMHLHGGQFQVLKRAGGGEVAASLREGFTDEGWKDTILVLPGERVQLLMRFPEFKGLFLYHCHNLEHEDMGMMRNYKLE